MRLAVLITTVVAAFCIGGLCLADGRDKNHDGIPDANAKKSPKQEKAEHPKKQPHPDGEKKKKDEDKNGGKKKDGDKKDEKKKSPKKERAKKEGDSKPAPKKPQAADETPKGKPNDSAAKAAQKDAAEKPATASSTAEPGKPAASGSDGTIPAKKPGKHHKKHKAPAQADDATSPFSARRDVDSRESHQQKRIAFGIRSGALTKDEAASLERREHDIKDLEASFRSDGHLSAAERKQLQTKLDDASRMIFAGKHDTDGWQMPVLRFGTNVFAKSDHLQKLESEHLSAAEGRTMAADYRRALALHRRLGHDGLTPEQRTEMQREYSDLLHKYFDVRNP